MDQELDNIDITWRVNYVRTSPGPEYLHLQNDGNNTSSKATKAP